MCIKNQDYIHGFFDKNPNKIFLSYCGEDWNIKAQSRIRYFYIQAGHNSFLRCFNKFSVTFQKFIGIDRLAKNRMVKFVGGANWFSLPEDFVKYIVKNKRQVCDMFNYSYCADELFVQTVAYNEQAFRERIYLLKINCLNNSNDTDRYKSNQRYIDWNRGQPYIFRQTDFDELMNVEYCFARKFIYSNENRIMEMILDAR